MMVLKPMVALGQLSLTTFSKLLNGYYTDANPFILSFLLDAVLLLFDNHFEKVQKKFTTIDDNSFVA